MVLCCHKRVMKTCYQTPTFYRKHKGLLWQECGGNIELLYISSLKRTASLSPEKSWDAWEKTYPFLFWGFVLAYFQKIVLIVSTYSTLPNPTCPNPTLLHLPTLPTMLPLFSQPSGLELRQLPLKPLPKWKAIGLSSCVICRFSKWNWLP